MTEYSPTPAVETISRKDCYYTLSISIGAGLTFLLGMLPPLNILCINFIIGGLATVSHFNKVNEISVSRSFGIRVAFYGAALGALLLIFTQDIMFYRLFGNDLSEVKQLYVELLNRFMEPEAVAEVIAGIPDKLSLGLFIQISFWQIVVFMLAAFLTSLISGSFAAAKFKRGPLVK